MKTKEATSTQLQNVVEVAGAVVAAVIAVVCGGVAVVTLFTLSSSMTHVVNLQHVNNEQFCRKHILQEEW